MTAFKDFMKKNYYTMIRLMVNQVALSLFSIMMVSIEVVLDANFITLLVSLFCIGFYLYLQYATMWQLAAKDSVRVESRQERRIRYKGLYIALGANVINILLVVLSTVGRLSGNGILALAKIVIHLTQAMYNGLIVLYSPYNVLGHILILFPAVIAVTLGYEFGFRNFRIASLFGIKEKTKEPKQ